MPCQVMYSIHWSSLGGLLAHDDLRCKAVQDQQHIRPAKVLTSVKNKEHQNIHQNQNIRTSQRSVHTTSVFARLENAATLQVLTGPSWQ